ncbi:hypothetical protein BDW42DRAFT_160496 [Aspergillus taichungensis]|uniref:Uncharacterized protein n=1 Tax=Aspergillus taichungensis TaxID=482145 RepID=A0A2J5I6I0_9EURO|nr:hypothetical protein BDW42DRAFT_160496 [Aspergillus taichungensis]
MARSSDTTPFVEYILRSRYVLYCLCMYALPLLVPLKHWGGLQMSHQRLSAC